MMNMKTQHTMISEVLDVQTKQIQGQSVPALGFGTFQMKGTACQSAVSTAIEIGYRHIDTARMYENEADVGKGIKDSGIPRKDLFVTSKIWIDTLDPEGIARETRKSLELLQTDYVDLMLIHWPNPDQNLEESLSAMLEELTEGRIKRVGVSNFPPNLFKEALAYAPIFCNQVEYHVCLNQEKLVGIARAHDILLTAFSPLAQGSLSGQEALIKVAKKYGKSTEQVALRWLIQQDHVAAIPRSSNPDHMRSNFEIFDFELDLHDLKLIDQLPKDQRVINPDFAPDWENG